jgi:Tol biopolymer transport system component
VTPAHRRIHITVAVSFLTVTLVLSGGSPASAAIKHGIVFARNLHGHAQIYVMAPDGSGQTRLTFRKGWDEYPEWSPDGSEIAFDEINAALPNRASGIFVKAADGSGLTRLTSNATGYDQEPTWSPDGTRIAFASDRGGQSDIYLINADGSGLTQLTDDAATDIDPEWSPDGTEIAYASTRRSHPDIFIVASDGTGRVRLTRNVADDFNPAWSPDGSTIAFASDRHGSYDLFTVGTEGSGLRRITTTRNIYEREPTFSPNGRRLALDRYRQVGAVLADIYAIRLNDGAVSRLTNTHQANFSPDWH